MSDDSSLRRQWILINSLSSRRLGLTVREMADETGVHEKTVRRDLSLFRSLGFPLVEEVGDFGRKTWRIAATAKQPLFGFSLDEAVALHLGQRLLEPLAGTVFWDASRRAFQKVRAALGPSALEYVDRFASLFHHTAFGAHDYTQRAELIDALQVAAEDRNVVRLRYRSEGQDEPSDREVHPYGFVFHRGALHLVALDPLPDKVKHFKIDRIEAAEVGTCTFRRRPGFDFAKHLAATFGVYQSDGEVVRVRARFNPEAARYVEESQWQNSQKLTKQRDGGLVAEFRLSCTEEIKHWLLSFGAKALVLEPERLRREIEEELRALLAAYASLDARAHPQAVPLTSASHGGG